MNDLLKVVFASLALIPTFIAWYVIFALLEWVFCAVAHKSLQGWLFNLGTSALYYLFGILAGAASAWIASEIQTILHGSLIDMRVRNTNTLTGATAAVALNFLVYDFFYYWWHRLQHKNSYLWAIHIVHHLDEGINVSTTLRHHWLEDFGRIFVITAPTALLLDLSPIEGGGIGFFFSGVGFFIHANIRLNLGPASWLIGGPQVHRIHHSILPEHLNKNFAAIFPLYDVLFRTYYHPCHGEFPPTGVAGESSPSSVAQGSFVPFRIWREAKSRPQRREMDSLIAGHKQER